MLNLRKSFSWMAAALVAAGMLSCAQDMQPPDMSVPKAGVSERPAAPTDVPDLQGAYEIPFLTLLKSISTTSTLPDPIWGPDGNAAWHLADGDPELPWCAGNRLLGIGEEIQVEFLHPLSLNSVTLVYPESLTGPRVAQLEIVTGDNESRVVDLPPSTGRAKFVPVNGRRFRLVVKKVASGDAATLCVGELKLGGRADVLDTKFPADAEPVAVSQIRTTFADIETFRQPSLGRPKLVRALSDFFSKWTGPGELASAKLLFDYQFQSAGDTRQSEDNLCVVATRAVIEANGTAERLFRERYLARRSVPLLESCATGEDLSYWVLRQNRMAVILFNARGDSYAALEAGDPRALPKILSVYRRNTKIGWWREPVSGYGDKSKSPEDLVVSMPRETARRILADLLSLEEKPGYYRDGLEALSRRMGS